MEKEIKCVIWDLDGTIWDGVLAEQDRLVVRPGIPGVIREFDARGIVNSVASRNDQAPALAELRRHVLLEYMVYPQIHWGAKSTSVASIQRRLNIGMDSLAFVDDDPFELDEVRSVHPEVLCIDARDAGSLLDHPRFRPRFITRDASRRRQMYLEDMERQAAEENFQGAGYDFLATLDMRFTITLASEEDLQRAEELTIRTNQLNATGRTYDYHELDALRTSPHHRLLICELTDRYGSYGKIGLALIELRKTCWHLRLMLMSCRVMSRGAGSVLLSVILQQARARGQRVLADFRDTGRNRQMYVTYKFAGFRELSPDGDGTMLLEHGLSGIPPLPDHLTIDVPDLAAPTTVPSGQA